MGSRTVLASSFFTSFFVVGCSLSGGSATGACDPSVAVCRGRPEGTRHADAAAAAFDGSVPPAPPPPPPSAPAVDAAVDRCAHRESMEPVVLYLSADDSGSMASPGVARMFAGTSGIPRSPGFFRTYEFLNYYDVHHPESPEQGHVGLHAAMRRDGGEESSDRFVFQVSAQAAPLAVRPRRVITFVLDRSGSMRGPPIEREADVVRAIAAGLAEGDEVNWVEWSTERAVRLEGYRVSGPDDPTIVSLASALAADGGTDLEAGLRRGYELAQASYDPTALNRVVLVSDGGANAGITDLDLIAEHADDADTAGIYLVGVGVGTGVNDTLLDAVTDAGRGAYVFVDSAHEARSLFVDRFTEVMDVALMGVQLEVTLPWYMAITEFHGEEYSVGDPTAVRPQHLAPGDAMVFHQLLEACDPSAVQSSDAVRLRVTYTRPEGRVAAEDVVLTTIGELLEGDRAWLARGDAIVAYAEGVRMLASAEEGARDELARALAFADVADPEHADPRLEEIRAIIGRIAP